jgi:hypothetical protein
VTTAYDVLRHSGMPVGKLDYLGKLSAPGGLGCAQFPVWG